MPRDTWTAKETRAAYEWLVGARSINGQIEADNKELANLVNSAKALLPRSSSVPAGQGGHAARVLREERKELAHRIATSPARNRKPYEPMSALMPRKAWAAKDMASVRDWFAEANAVNGQIASDNKELAELVHSAKALLPRRRKSFASSPARSRQPYHPMSAPEFCAPTVEVRAARSLRGESCFREPHPGGFDSLAQVVDDVETVQPEMAAVAQSAMLECKKFALLGTIKEQDFDGNLGDQGHNGLVEPLSSIPVLFHQPDAPEQAAVVKQQVHVVECLHDIVERATEPPAVRPVDMVSTEVALEQDQQQDEEMMAIFAAAEMAKIAPHTSQQRSPEQQPLKEHAARSQQLARNQLMPPTRSMDEAAAAIRPDSTSLWKAPEGSLKRLPENDAVHQLIDVAVVTRGRAPNQVAEQEIAAEQTAQNEKAAAAAATEESSAVVNQLEEETAAEQTAQNEKAAAAAATEESSAVVNQLEEETAAEQTAQNEKAAAASAADESSAGFNQVEEETAAEQTAQNEKAAAAAATEESSAVVNQVEEETAAEQTAQNEAVVNQVEEENRAEHTPQIEEAPAPVETEESDAALQQSEEEGAAEQTAQIEPAIATTEESRAVNQAQVETVEEQTVQIEEVLATPATEETIAVLNHGEGSLPEFSRIEESQVEGQGMTEAAVVESKEDTEISAAKEANAAATPPWCLLGRSGVRVPGGKAENEFHVELLKGSRGLGLTVCPVHQHELAVVDVDSEGAVGGYNATELAKDSAKLILPRMLITEVNGIRGDASRMVEALSRSTKLEVWVRPTIRQTPLQDDSTLTKDMVSIVGAVNAVRHVRSARLPGFS